MHGNDRMMKSLGRELDKVKNAMRGKTTMNLDGLLKRMNSPFTTGVLECHLPPKFCLPQLEFYDGTKEPLDHIRAFKTILNLQQTSDEVIYRSFPTTLRGAARVWFSKLLASSSANFEQLNDSFVQHFNGGQCHKRPISYLLTIRQQKGESLRDYVKHSIKLFSRLMRLATRLSWRPFKLDSTTPISSFHWERHHQLLWQTYCSRLRSTWMGRTHSLQKDWRANGRRKKPVTPRVSKGPKRPFNGNQG